MDHEGVLDWMPDPVGRALEELETVTVDTARLLSDPSGDMLRRANHMMNSGAAVLEEDGSLKSYTIADDRAKLEKHLRTIEERRERGEPWQCAALMVTSTPQRWMMSSEIRWRFLDELGEEARRVLAADLAKELGHMINTRYITESEYERAIRDLDRWVSTGHSYGPRELGGQPYNMDVPSHARRLGIAGAQEPFVGLVRFGGRYLDQTDREAQDWASYLAAKDKKIHETEVTTEDVCEVLRKYDWDGTFTRHGFGSVGGLSIWNPDKIQSITEASI